MYERMFLNTKKSDRFPNILSVLEVDNGAEKWYDKMKKILKD